VATFGQARAITQQYADHQYFNWQPPGKLISVEVRLDIIDAINRDVMEAFHTVPVRGAEIGGILLGNVEQGAKTVLHIERHVPVPCMYATGPSYRFSESDEIRFAETLAQFQAGREKLRLVGLYRSHTRKDLFLSAYDLAFWGNYLPSAESVFLLVKPFVTRPNVGGFFFREQGQVHATKSYLEFPFQSSQTGAAPAEPLADSIPEATPPRHDDLSLAVIPPRPAVDNLSRRTEPALFDSFASVPAHSRTRWPWLALPGLLVVTILALFGLTGSGILSLPLGENRKAVPARAYSLGLEATENGAQVKIRWDRQSPAIAEAQRGVLSISDGTFRKDLELEANELRTGSLSYAALTPQIDFRLEVFTDKRSSVSQTLTFNGSVGEQTPPVQETPLLVVHEIPVPSPPAEKSRSFRYLSIPGRQPVSKLAAEPVSNPRAPAAQTVPSPPKNEANPAQATEIEIGRPAARR